MSAEDSQIDHSLTRKAKDVAAGFIGGAVQVLIGQPFDLVKVRMQTGQFSSPFTAITETLAKEGPSAFYKGTLAPLFGVGLCVSVQFYGFHEAKRQLLKYGNSGTGARQTELTLPQFYLAGAFAGIVNTPITAPVEQVRILLQTQKSGAEKLYEGPRDAVNKIYREAGLFKGLGRGSLITILRESQAYGVWFLTYEFFMHQALKRGIKREDISTPELMLYGAIAGDALWLSSYPLDVIKSKIQSDGFGASSKYHGKITPVIAEVMAKEGLRGFWRGIGPALVRAIPCSAATFTSVEYALRLMG